MSATGKMSRALKSAEGGIVAFPSYPYAFGYLQGAIKTALIQLEYGNADLAANSLRAAIGLSERPFPEGMADA